MKLEFSPQIFNKFQISNFTKIRRVQGNFFHAKGQAKLKVAFRKFAKALKNTTTSHIHKKTKFYFS
jgi:hypothetical protein